MKKRWKLITLCLVSAVAVASLYAWTEFNRELKDTAVLKADFTLDAKTLHAAFQTDEMKAGRQYNDKVLLVAGQLSDMAVGDSTVNMILDAGSDLGGVLCQFEKAQAEQLGQLKPGTRVQVKGVCTGMLLDVVLVRCVLEPAKGS